MVVEEVILMENQKKTVIITGGGQVLLDNGRPGAIGYGIACAFAKAGWNIVITGRNKQKLYDAKESLEKEYDASVLCVPADIEYGQDNEKVVQNVIDQTIDQFKEIHGLVNCAQASASGVPFEQQTLEQFNLAIYSGLYATFFYMKAAYPYLKKTKGSIVNFGSGAALFGNAGQSSYAAAKEGIRGLSRVAATEWAKDGINVNIICPLAWTKQLEQFKTNYPEAYEKNVHMPPCGYYGDPMNDIGEACVTLMSDSLKYMTGETITLEGGLGQRP